MKNPTAVSQFVYVRTHAVTKVLEGLIWNCVLVVLIIEAFYAIPLRFPSLLKYAPNAIVNEIRRVYDSEDRNIIQFYKPCAQYDPYVTYTLRPGHCVFANREFSTDVLINRLGTRDTEDASVKPEIVVLGDSFTMGWGVKQDETFAKVLEKMVGMKVLNAGISSYDTVREMRLLDRVDMSNVKYLILQYCDNDYAENVKLHKYQNYNIMGRQLYNHIINMVASKYANYTFGSYTAQALVRIRDSLTELGKNGFKNGFAGNSDKRNYNEEVESFLYVLTHAGKSDLSKLTVIVFEANVPIYRHDDGFVRRLSERIKDAQGKNLPKRIITENVLKDLGEEHYYVLDEHFKPKAHLFIASRLAATIVKEERTN